LNSYNNIIYIKQLYSNTIGKVLRFPEEAGRGLGRGLGRHEYNLLFNNYTIIVHNILSETLLYVRLDEYYILHHVETLCILEDSSADVCS